MIPIVIEGTDGSGKTPLVLALQEEIHRRGFSIAICAPFTTVNRVLGQDVYGLFMGGQYDRAMELLACAVQAPYADFVVYDRGWMTVERCLADGGAPPSTYARAAQLFPRHPTVSLFCSVEHTLVKCNRRNIIPPWDLTLDRQKRLDLAQDPCVLMNLESTGQLNLTVLASRIFNRIEVTHATSDKVLDQHPYDSSGIQN